MSAAASTIPIGDASVVYFGSVAREVTEDELKAFVSKAGNPVAVERRRGYAYVQYKDAAAANKAVSSLNGAELKGKNVVAEASKVPADRPPRPARAPRDTTGLPTHTDRVIVRNLPKEFDSEALSKAMATVGPVVKARMTGGLGRVQFENDASAAKALELSGSNISGREIKVEYELLREKKARTPKAAAAGAGAAAGEKKGKKAAAAAPKAEAGAGRRRKAEETEEAEAPSANPNLLWIGNLGGEVTEDQVKAVVAPFGAVEDIKIRSNRPRVRRGEPKPEESTIGRSAYVTFAAESSVSAASAALEGKTGVLGAGEGGLKAAAARPPRRAKAASPKKASASPSKGAAAPAKERAPRTPREPRSIRIEGLPAGATPEQLQTAFASAGAIRNAKIVEEKSMGYVNFEDAEGAKKGSEMTDVKIAGTAVTVVLTAPRVGGRRRYNGTRRSPKASE